MMKWSELVFPVVIVMASASIAAAQTDNQRGSTAVEFGGGYAAFVDESPIDHTVVGGALRFHLTPRISVGPEVTYMIGPGHDRDLFVTGNVVFDLLPSSRSRIPPVMPFVVAGGGIQRFSNRFGSSSFSSWEGAVTGGGGVRIRLSNRVYVAPEFRIGWEPHYRFIAAVGVTLP